MEVGIDVGVQINIYVYIYTNYPHFWLRVELRDGIFILKLEFVIEIISQKTVKIEKEINNIKKIFFETQDESVFFSAR